ASARAPARIPRRACTKRSARQGKASCALPSRTSTPRTRAIPRSAPCATGPAHEEGTAMLRKTEPRVVATFRTPPAATQTEQAARAQAVPGRLIPVPRAITARCGLAWSAPPEAEEALRALFDRIGVTPQGIYHLTI